MARSNGTVKWYNDVKGFGFITPDEGGEDLFAHKSQISRHGARALEEGQAVSYEAVRGPKGLEARDIQPI